MSETVINVENLSKKYLIKHQADMGNDTLVDSITNGVKALFHRDKQNTKSEEEFWALKDVSFDIKRGDKVGIIGRNGAGKSTLLKILSRIVEPTSGRITIDGKISSLLEVGTGFHGELSGRENIFLNGSILGMGRTEIRSKFDEIVAFAEIEKFIDTPVKRYSSGMYVRLAFAVAAHLDPEILILDEVLAVGDAAFQKKCIGKIGEVSNSGKTILFVSHSMDVVQKICNVGVLLHKGELVLSGSMSSVIGGYLDQKKSYTPSFDVPLPVNYNLLSGYVTNITIENQNGIPSYEIPIGVNWQVRVKYIVNDQTNNFVIGIGLLTGTGLSIRTVWSTPSFQTKGEYEAIFTMGDIAFGEGLYNVVVGLSKDNETFHFVNDLVSFTISEISTLTNDPQIINTKSGLILNQSPVQINKLI